MVDKLNPKIQSYLNYVQSVTQDGPRLGNQFTEDTALQSYLPLFLPASVLDEVRASLTEFGAKMASPEFLEFGNNAELFTPVLQQFDAVGRRIDRIHVAEGWKNLSREAAKDGVVALAYEQDDDKTKLGKLIIYKHESIVKFKNKNHYKVLTDV
jgi:hypothetical protein